MVILCDFDDTVAERNVASLLLERFEGSAGGPPWQQIRRRFRQGAISLAEYQEQAFDRLTASRHEQEEFVRSEAALRPGFPELAAYCTERGIPLAIVSHGLDFYVRAALDQAGVGHVPFIATTTAISPGGQTYAYPFAVEACDWYPGNCKCAVLERHRGEGSLIYAGDGMSDACPARKADYVFARDPLLGVCEAEGIPHQELTDFRAVLEYVRTAITEGSS